MFNYIPSLKQYKASSSLSTVFSVFQFPLFALEATLERITIDYHQNHSKL